MPCCCKQWHLCIRPYPECWWTCCPWPGRGQGRKAEHNRTLLLLPCFPAWAGGRGESGPVWLLSWRISPAQLACSCCSYCPLSALLSLMPDTKKLFLFVAMCQQFYWPVSLSNLAEPVTFLSCLCWVIHQIPFFIQILPASTTKEKNKCPQRLVRTLIIPISSLLPAIASFCCIYLEFQLTHWMALWKACKSTRMKQEKFHKEGFKCNPSSLPRTFKKI